MDADGESIGDVEDLIRYNARYNAVIYYDAMTLINSWSPAFGMPWRLRWFRTRSIYLKRAAAR